MFPGTKVVQHIGSVIGDPISSNKYPFEYIVQVYPELAQLSEVTLCSLRKFRYFNSRLSSTYRAHRKLVLILARV